MRIKLIVFAVTLMFILQPLYLSRPAAATATHPANTVYLFVEFETKVYRKDVPISSANPSERRWYFSNVIVPMDVPTYSLIKQKIMPYFSHNVMDPFEARGGLSLDYGEQDVKLNGESSYANYETREEAEAQHTKEIEYRKNQSGNIYSFELVFDKPAKGEETTKPKLIYRDQEQPNYGSAK